MLLVDYREVDILLLGNFKPILEHQRLVGLIEVGLSIRRLPFSDAVSIRVGHHHRGYLRRITICARREFIHDVVHAV